MRRTRRSEEDFRDEIEAHLQLEADRLVQEEGMPQEQAFARARRAFGNVTRSREQFYESRRFMWLDNIIRDVRYALRQLKSSPISAIAIILSLALGIGVNTAIFSLADQALLRALPVDEPEELVQLHWNGPFPGTGMGSVGYGSLVPYLLYRDLRAQNEVFEDLLARSPAEVHLSLGDQTEAVHAEVVTGSYFSTLGVRPAVGRLLGDADDLKPDAHPVIVVSFDYWQNRLGADPDIVGKQVRMNDHPMKIVGVAERGFHGMDWGMVPSIWVPAMMKQRVTPGWNGLFERRVRFMHAFARLRPGVSQEEAEASIEPWFKAYLQADTEREGWPGLSDRQMDEYLASSLELRPGAQGESFLRRRIERPMLILAAATSLVLLLACLNVANLSLSRALTRRRATALRTALGASKTRIATEQLVESAVLALAGCALGALMTPPVSRALISFLPVHGGEGVALSPGLDPRVLMLAAAIACLATLVSGAAPALYAASVRPVNALKRQSSAVAGSLGLRKALVVGQFVLALVLLIGAGLFAQTLAALREQGPGFPTTNLLMFRVDPPSDGYGVEETKPVLRRLLEEMQALPDIDRAALAAYALLTGGSWNNPVTIEANGRSVTDRSIPMNGVSAGFFGALGAAIVRGRDFDARDSHDAEWALRSAIVNEEFVRRYLAGSNPVGARVGIGARPDTEAGIEIVGVVSDFKNTSLREPEAQIFFSLWERSVRQGTFFARSRSSSEMAARSIRSAVRRVDPALTVVALRTVDDQLDHLLTNERMLAMLAGAFAAVATALAMIGLYGVLSFSAERRTREFGIRYAFGAPRWAAGQLIAREAGLLALAGLAIALPLSWALGRLIENQLFGVGPMDAKILAGASGILTLVCLVAGAVAARRAGAVSPVEALRSE